MLPLPEHSPLGASKAGRWLNCPASVAACAGIPDVPSEAAAAGTRAHEIAAAALRNMVGRVSRDAYLAEDLPMVAAINAYLDECYQIIDQGAPYWVEKRFEMPDLHPQLYGTADCAAVLGTTLYVWDAKFGFGRVDAIDNPQLAYYALGALTALASEYPEIGRVVATIVQPRIGNISSVEWSAMDLMFEWGARFRNGAIATEAPDAPFCVGEWCKYCPAALTCGALRAEAEAAPAKKPDTMDAAALGRAVQIAKGVSGWAKKVEAEALARAVAGSPPAGYKAVAGPGRRYWKDDATALREMQAATGCDINGLAPRELMSPAQFAERYGDEVYGRIAVHAGKSEPSPVLAKVTDKRDPWSPRSRDVFDDLADLSELDL